MDIPVRLVQGATIQVLAFDDANGNGVRDAGEDVAPNVTFCVEPLPLAPGGGFGGPGFGGPGFGCPRTDDDGLASLGPLTPGDYQVYFQGAASAGFVRNLGSDSVSAARRTRRDEDAEFAVDVITPAEQVIYPGTGEQALPINVCYSDPAWVNPPFVDLGPNSQASQMGYTDGSRRARFTATAFTPGNPQHMERRDGHFE